MAGEYSRELSAKVFAGQCRLIEHGFRQGGPAGFGAADGAGEAAGFGAAGAGALGVMAAAAAAVAELAS